MAPAHIAQGSSVTYSVVPVRRSLRTRAAPSRKTSISAWAVGSRVWIIAFPALASTSPAAEISTAPTGTSPPLPAASACSSASFKKAKSSSFIVLQNSRSTGMAENSQTEESKTGERIAKVIARSGVCSRRDAEKLITEGRVAVNGQQIATPALNVAADALITVDGKPIREAQPTKLWRYHKPEGLVTTHRDPEGRPTVFSRLPPSMPRTISIGRLDLNSEGLLLLTNDGELARKLELPAQGWVRRYRVRLFGSVTQEQLNRLAQGVTVDGVRYQPVKAELERARGPYAWTIVSLQEGKNREIKRLMEYLGLKVARLIRVSFGPFHLGHLPEGAVAEIPGKVWREQLGMGNRLRRSGS